MGFYSAFMVSKKVEIRTKSYKADAKAICWSCDGSPEFEMNKIDKENRGTDIVLYIDDECKEFLEKDKIESLLKKYCKFLPIPVVFGKKQEWKDGKMTDTDDDNVINDTKPAWTRQPSELKDEDYIKFYHELYPGEEDPLFWIHLNVDYPFTLTGILYFPKLKNEMDVQKNRIQLYCNQVFVTDSVEGVVPDFMMIMRGVIDSPDIPLNVSRSYLQSDSNVKKISSYISKKVASQLENIFKNRRNEYETKWNDIKIFIEYGMLSDEKFCDAAMKFALLANVEDKKFTLDEYKELIAANQTDKDGNLVYLYATDKTAQYSYIKAAKDKGVEIDVVGVGSSSPMPIPMGGGTYMSFNNQLVRTAFNEQSAQEIAKVGTGVYVSGNNTSAVDILDDQLKKAKKTNMDKKVFSPADEQFPVFAWIALILLVTDILVSEKKISWLTKTNFFGK